MYRVLGRLDVGKGRVLYPGSFSRLEWLNETGLARLERKGSISRVQPPPLAVLPGWGARSRKIEEVLGVKDAEQFLEADNQKIAEAMEENAETVKEWKSDIMSWLTAKPVKGG